jgi:UDP-N-acetylmuramyl pentapeptide phosphotransferase/UDP-N-acetylglucosamine-1-phosphate transferase
MLLLSIFFTSMLGVVIFIPSIIKVAFKKRLFDMPTDGRKVHKRIVPAFGGIAIFTMLLFSCSLFIPPATLPQANIVLAAALILFMTGLQDDIVGLDPLPKFAAQFTSAIIVAVPAKLQITNLDGILGIEELSPYSGLLLTVFFIVGVVNAFNLIDGIDGLVGSLAFIFSLTYAILFYLAGEIGWVYVALALNGAIIGFLCYNVTPAKIFMGDSGSLLIGLFAAVFSIKFLTLQDRPDLNIAGMPVRFSPALVVAILIIPLFDTLRVFSLRILRNTSPFKADKNHLHHRLLFVNLSHVQATLILAICNMLFVMLSLVLQQRVSTAQLIAILIVGILTINGGLSLYIERYKKSILMVKADGTLNAQPFVDAEQDVVNRN